MKVLVLVGSQRPDSFNGRLARAAARELPAGVDAVYFDQLNDLPHYSEELDANAVPAAATALREAVGEADALLVVTPEYNGLPPSLIKNAIDWASRPHGASPLKGTPSAVLAASPVQYGAQWAREGLVRALGIAGAKVLEDTVGVGSAHEVLDGDTITDPEVKSSVATLIGQLVESVAAPVVPVS